jgi:antitoxin ParD1/3/4
MNISLTPELERFVNEKVGSGLYQTASEVVREGLRLLREREEMYQKKLEALRKDLAAGIEEADRGEVAPLNARETLARVRKKRQAQAGKKK